jgi:high-affinity nickel permease
MSSTENIGAIIGTAVSATVLFAIGGFNLYIAHGLWRRWSQPTEQTYARLHHPSPLTAYQP